MKKSILWCTVRKTSNYEIVVALMFHKNKWHIAHLRQQCHNSKSVIFQEKLLKVSKCYIFLWVQWRHNCPLAASFGNCVITLHLLKVHLQTFLSIPKFLCRNFSLCHSCRKWVIYAKIIVNDSLCTTSYDFVVCTKKNYIYFVI